MPVLLGNVGGHIGDYVAFECPGKSAVQEEDRTDRARDSRGSFRLSNLVQARMEQHSTSSVVPSNVRGASSACS